MNSGSEINSKGLNDNAKNDDVIDFNQIFLALFSEKKIIAFFIFVGVIFSGIKAFTSKRVWQGEFQIVLQQNDGGIADLGLGSATTTLSEIIGIGSSSGNLLQTEVAILESPYVLMGIFEDLKKKKISRNQKSFEDLKFKEWKKGALRIKLERSTSVLNLSYRDSDKDLIIPVLNNISNTYQDYSDKKRLKNIEPVINYLEDQVKIYQEKSSESLSKLQQFATKQDLTLLSAVEDIDNRINLPNFINIENERVKASNLIREVDFQLNKIRDLDPNKIEIQFLINALPQLKDLELISQIELLEKEISLAKSIYRDNDKTILKLLKKKYVFLESLKKISIESLESEKFLLQSKINASKRPKGVLVKYRQLLSTASKDKAIVDSLENQYRFALLSKAKSTSPWELITKPTLLSYPVAPARKMLLIQGFIAGLSLGVIVGLINSSRKDLILSSKEIKRITTNPLIFEFDPNKISECEDNLYFFLDRIKRDYKGDIVLMKIGKIKNLYIQSLNKSITKLINDRKVIITDNLISASEFQNIFVIVETSNSKRKDLLNFKEKMSLQNKIIDGIFLINKKNNFI